MRFSCFSVIKVSCTRSHPCYHCLCDRIMPLFRGLKLHHSCFIDLCIYTFSVWSISFLLLVWLFFFWHYKPTLQGCYFSRSVFRCTLSRDVAFIGLTIEFSRSESYLACWEKTSIPTEGSRSGSQADCLRGSGFQLLSSCLASSWSLSLSLNLSLASRRFFSRLRSIARMSWMIIGCCIPLGSRGPPLYTGLSSFFGLRLWNIDHIIIIYIIHSFQFNIFFIMPSKEGLYCSSPYISVGFSVFLEIKISPVTMYACR